MPRINSDDVREHLGYDPATGRFWWKDEPGTIAGNGYHYIRVCGKMRLAHRMAWAFHYGEEPDGLVDHINGDRSDNRIVNLRLASYSQNSANAKRHSRNTSGFKGASWDKHKKMWQATITVQRKQIMIGRYKTKEEAHAAYVREARRHQGEFANDGLAIAPPPSSVHRDWLLVATPRVWE